MIFLLLIKKKKTVVVVQEEYHFGQLKAYCFQNALIDHFFGSLCIRLFGCLGATC
jgi:hypothetical protein